MNVRSNSIMEKSSELIISHSGYIDEKIIIEKGHDIRLLFKNDIHLSRKIFSIYMELIQNIFYYSSEKIIIDGKRFGIGSINIVKDGSGYTIQSCNLAEKAFINVIRKKFPIINSLTKEELRKLKIKQRRQPQEPLSKGAGIGLIQMSIISENPLKIFFESANDNQSYYNIHVRVDSIR